MSEATKGPWKVGFDKGVSAAILDRNPGYIAVVAPAGPFVFGGVVAIVEGKANARLIAAAPDLLDAARSAIAQFERIKTHQHELLDHGLAEAEKNWDRATLGQYIEFAGLIAAIAKAEGRSHD
jgi:hypothetical protein